MNKFILFLTFLGFTFSANLIAQEGLYPLGGNEKLQFESKSNSQPEVGETYTYKFLFNLQHLPFRDDFSKNKFKQYTFDYTAPGNTIEVWEKFLKDGVWVQNFDAMTDTSYHFTYDSVALAWDSVANPVVIISNFSTVNYQVIESYDTVWTWDTLVVGNTVITNHLANVNYVNFSDTVVVVPDDDYSLWRNNNALHNYTYSAEPITQGMATFDGLDSTGVPYDPTMNPNAYQIADVLESKPIYLKTDPNGGADYSPLHDTDIYLSFYYQPQGLGDSPEPSDSLVLEFYSPFDETWTHMWSAPGGPIHPFRSVLIHVIDPRYFLDGFKFRFKNYASVSGNFDHWNIDYVRLAEGRSASDSTLNDVGLLDPGYSLLLDYHQMPWAHYKNSTQTLMKDEQEIRYRNVGTVTHLARSVFNVYDEGVLLPSFNASPGINPQFGPLAIGSEVSPFFDVYPKTNTDTVKSFHVEYLAEVNPDLNHLNDTAVFHQQFGSQYAYDDGTAESAYFVTSIGAQIAVEYKIAVGDSLRAINIYFPRSYESILDRPYRLMVWKSLDPEEVLYESYLNYPVYAGGRDLVQGIKLEEPIYVEGTIYIGIKQLDGRVFIGMDKNNNSRTKNYYKVGGNWATTSYDGSLFIRPEFGFRTEPWPVSVDEFIENPSFNMYPNPSSSTVNLELDNSQSRVVLRSLLGVQIKEFLANGNISFDVSGLPTGLYIVEVINQSTGKSSIKKLLIQQ